MDQLQHADQLLLQFANDLQEWDAETAAGLAAVTTFQRCLGGIEVASQPPKEAEETYKRLLDLAPSFRLEQYIQQQHNPAAAATDAASQLHTAVSTLRASLAAQRELLASMSAACEQYQEAVLSQTLQDTALTAPTPSELPGAADQQDAADTAAAAGHGPSGEAAAAHEVWQPEELALLMDALTAGLQQDLEWMEAASSSISLETSQEELNTLSTLWELQPFTNEAAAASITAAATAAAAAAAAATSDKEAAAT